MGCLHLPKEVKNLTWVDYMFAALLLESFSQTTSCYIKDQMVHALWLKRTWLWARGHLGVEVQDFLIRSGYRRRQELRRQLRRTWCWRHQRKQSSKFHLACHMKQSWNPSPTHKQPCGCDHVSRLGQGKLTCTSTNLNTMDPIVVVEQLGSIEDSPGPGIIEPCRVPHGHLGIVWWIGDRGKMLKGEFARTCTQGHHVLRLDWIGAHSKNSNFEKSRGQLVPLIGLTKPCMLTASTQLAITGKATTPPTISWWGCGSLW